ncbi:MAG: PAS domain S-box protein [SAR324 cluster bacterium]|nr:PAS domain S-box protein [SAR324 cluster bacterium]
MSSDPPPVNTNDNLKLPHQHWTQAIPYKELLNVVQDAIVVVNQQGLILWANPQIETLFGYPCLEITGQPLDCLIPQHFRKNHLKHVSGYFNKPEARKMRQAHLCGLHRDGHEIPVEINLLPLKLEDELLVVSLIRDVSHLRHVEALYQQCVVGHDERLSQMRHRAKNNLALIISLLDLQMSNQSENQLISLLTQTKERVYAIALVHEQLSQRSGKTVLLASDLIRKLTEPFQKTQARHLINITLEMDARKIWFSMDEGVPLMLLLNELITNAMNHAFEPYQAGEIRIALTSVRGKCHMTLKDNGRGLPEDVEPSTAASLGFRLIYGLTLQLRGKITLERNAGTTFHLKFPLSVKTSRAGTKNN